MIDLRVRVSVFFQFLFLIFPSLFHQSSGSGLTFFKWQAWQSEVLDARAKFSSP